MTSPEDAGLCLVTGGSSGIGLAACHALARRGYHIVLTSRSQGRADRARRAILAAHPKARVEAATLDFECLDDVRRFADQFQRNHRALRVLISNAGAVYPRRRVTTDGFEAQLAVIHLGPFLLTQRLLPLLRAGTPARIVNVVSDLHKGAHLDWGDLPMGRRYNFLTSYRQAELLKVLYTYALARRLGNSGVTANGVHPGGVRTRLFREFRGPFGGLWWLSGWLKKGPHAGAKGLVYLASDPGAAVHNGGYFHGTRPCKSSRTSYDPALQARAWRISADLVGWEAED
ncbi:MAG: SDR family NAD(P)-dependent oxidoreductase [Candidatus Competibacterales bacterium]